MRVAVVTESFLPHVNGVTNSVCRIVDRLLDTGHEPVVIAPGPGTGHYRGARVVRVRSIGLPGYRSFRLGLPDALVRETMAAFAPDVVHLASPVALGAVGLRAARRLGIPTVAVYQTDVGGFARQYGVRAETVVSRWVAHLHRRCTRTLVPSMSSYSQLTALGVANLHLWRRGVSLDLFGPHRRSAELHARWTTGWPDRVVVGYVGRLAAEKRVCRLEDVARLPGVRLVVIGDGPERGRLQRRLPDASFTGMLQGHELARAFASLDVFVHTGEAETFCQTVQEAQASGVPVVAPAVGGPLDLVEQGVTGLLYDPADAWSLQRSVATLVGNAALRRQLAEQAQQRVSLRDWARVVDELIGLHYAAVMASPATGLAA